MLFFGVDVPLIEIVFALTLVNIIILIEVIVVVVLLMRGLKKIRR